MKNVTRSGDIFRLLPQVTRREIADCYENERASTAVVPLVAIHHSYCLYHSILWRINTNFMQSVNSCETPLVLRQIWGLISAQN